MTKRLLLLAALSCAMLCACDRKPAEPTTPSAATSAETEPTTEQPGQQPNDVLRAYYDAMNRGEWEAAYALVDPLDQAARPFEQFTKTLSAPVRQRTSRLQTVEILSVDEQGDRAIARVKSTRPDIAKIQRMMFAEHGPEVQQDNARVVELLVAALDAPDHPTLTREQDVMLRRVDGEWRLDFDWDKPIDRRPPVTTRLPTK